MGRAQTSLVTAVLKPERSTIAIVLSRPHLLTVDIFWYG